MGVKAFNDSHLKISDEGGRVSINSKGRLRSQTLKYTFESDQEIHSGKLILYAKRRLLWGWKVYLNHN